MLGNMPERMLERILKDMLERMFKNILEKILEDCLQYIVEVENKQMHLGGLLLYLIFVYLYMFDTWYPDMFWHIWC